MPVLALHDVESPLTVSTGPHNAAVGWGRGQGRHWRLHNGVASTRVGGPRNPVGRGRGRRGSTRTADTKNAEK